MNAVLLFKGTHTGTKRFDELTVEHTDRILAANRTQVTTTDNERLQCRAGL